VTARIYYTDSYCRRFEAVVTKAFEHEGLPAALLDRTAFYPTSGGQPFDTGRLNDVPVVNTLDVEGEVVHVVSSRIGEGVRVAAEIDWARRFDHMQQHTGQHVLSAAFDRLFDNRTVSFHMGAELSTIDLAREMSWEQVAQIEDLANHVVWDDRDVAIRFVSSKEAAALPLRKDPTRGGRLRLIDVKDFDLSACGGTHVGRTGAIGAILVNAVEKFKGGSRVTFVCGDRAVQAFRLLRESVAASVRALSVTAQELPSAIERLQSEERDLRRAMKRLQRSLAVHEAARLSADAAANQGVVVAALPDCDAAGLKVVATTIVARTSAMAALFSTSAPVAVVIARSADRTADAAAVLRALNARFGGRGGGKPELAQGGGLTGSLDDILAAARGLL